MSRGLVFSIFILIDLAIVTGVIWCAFHKIPLSKYLTPAIILFVLNGAWLIVVTVKNTPRAN
ncbi:MAG TPA: hypothetical protein VFB76_07070 [Candidatus Angelobacter sp.]|nr:hypothetical protein [Candidatus Angelobacter sp.]